jgi:type VI secretion system secreted protein VgrG
MLPAMVEVFEQSVALTISRACSPRRVSSRPGRVMLRDHDFQRPRVPLYARAYVERETEHAHEQYEYAPGVALSEAAAARSVLAVGGTPVADDRGGSRSRESHAERMALRRLEALQAERRILTFETSANKLSPGTVFRIGDHPRDDISSDKTRMSIRHVLEGKVADPKTWTFSVVAVDTNKPWRPSRVTPKPRILGLQTAVVVGPGQEVGGQAPVRLPNSLDANATIGSLPDSEIYVDEYGRVRVQFPWDREHGFD